MQYRDDQWRESGELDQRNVREVKHGRRKPARLGRALLLGLLIVVLVAGGVLLIRHGRAEAAGQKEPEKPGETTENLFVPDPSVPAAELPEGWEYRIMEAAALQEGTLVLVNADYGYDAELPRTVSVYDNKTGNYLVKDIYLSLDPTAMTQLNAWMDAFAAESGKRDVNIVAGWRSYDDQTAIYRNAVETKGQAHADAYIALPGHSEHHTGLALDLDTYDLSSGTSGGFDGDGAYTWAVDHAWEFGFIQRYPPAKSDITGIDYESWHFRYVGLPHSYIMSTKNLCLEEYIELLRQHPDTAEHLTCTCQGKTYELYYSPGPAVPVPTDRTYTVSGNNVDGYVITIEN